MTKKPRRVRAEPGQIVAARPGGRRADPRKQFKMRLPAEMHAWLESEAAQRGVDKMSVAEESMRWARREQRRPEMVRRLGEAVMGMAEIVVRAQGVNDWTDTDASRELTYGVLKEMVGSVAFQGMLMTSEQEEVAKALVRLAMSGDR
jgi:hypothetical protein